MAEHTVVILGGGTGAWPRPGGCAICWMRPTGWCWPAAADYQFAPSFSRVMTGTRRPGQVTARRAVRRICRRRR